MYYACATICQVPFDASISCRYFHRSFGDIVFSILNALQVTILKEFPVTIGWKDLSFSALWNTQMVTENSDDIYSIFQDNFERKILETIIPPRLFF